VIFGRRGGQRPAFGGNATASSKIVFAAAISRGAAGATLLGDSAVRWTSDGRARRDADKIRFASRDNAASVGRRDGDKTRARARRNDDKYAH